MNNQREQHAELVRQLVLDNPGLTASELWHHAPEHTKAVLLSPKYVGERLIDLFNWGKVRRGVGRLCSVSKESNTPTWLPQRASQASLF